METQKFQNLIQSITKRDLIISTSDIEIIEGKEYIIYKLLPLTERKISFKWKAANSNEKMLKSFITAFCNKYREPNPNAYNYNYGGKDYKWEDKTPIEIEYAYSHHVSRMYNKTTLMNQIESNFNSPEIEKALIDYGFYNTLYGIGIYALWQTQYVINAINKMKEFLRMQNIPFSNEYSEAMWVYRFKINLSKDVHYKLIQSFTI